MADDRLSGIVIGAAINLHQRLGPGLLESVYEKILEHQLLRAGLEVERQRQINIDYDGLHFDNAFCVDLIVERQLVVELKSVEKIAPVHVKQVLTYLRLLDLRFGLVINFGQATLKDGITRVVNGFPK